MKVKWRSGKVGETALGKRFIIIQNAPNADRPHQITFTLEELVKALDTLGPLQLEEYLLYLKRVITPPKRIIINANPS